MKLMVTLAVFLCLLAAIPITGEVYAGGMEKETAKEEIKPVEEETARSGEKQDTRSKVVWSVIGFLFALFITAL